MVFNRNYQPLITNTRPTVVDLSDRSQLADVNKFWKALSDEMIKHETPQQFVDALVELSRGIVYVYDPPRNRYLKVKLASPYVNFRYDPMALPWQQHGEHGATNDPQERSKHSDNASAVMSGGLASMEVIV